MSSTSLAKVLIYFLALTVSFGCKKKKQEDPTYKAEATINGQPWTSNSVTCVLLIDTVNNFRTVGITAEGSGKKLVVEFYHSGSGNSIQTGSRSFSSGNAFFTYQQ